MRLSLSVLLSSLALGACVTTAPDDRGRPVIAEDGAVVEATAVDATATTQQAQASDATFFAGSDSRSIAKDYLPATSLEPERNGADGLLELEAQDRIVGDDYSAAAKFLQESLRPSHGARPHYVLGLWQFKLANDEQALAAFERAVDLHPNYLKAWQKIGQLHYRAKDYAAAVPAFSRVVALGQADATTFGLLGICHAKSDDFVAAESAFRMAMVLEPSNVDWKKALAESLRFQRRYADAAALYEILIAAAPGDAALWQSQGEAFYRLGRSLEAAQNFEMAERLGGANAATLYNLGDIYSNERLYGPAVDAYRRAMSKDPAAGPDRALRAAAFLAQTGVRESGDLLDAIESTFGDQLVVEQQKKVLSTRARLAFKHGATDQEAAMLAQIVELDPLDGDALLKLGDHARRTENFAEAKSWFGRAASIREFEADALVGQARVLVHERKYADAVPLLTRAQSLNERGYVAEFLDRVERAARGR